MKKIPYTGIGSRKTPREIQIKMTEFATQLLRNNFILRSGGAEGADHAFEVGAKGVSEIFLPWKGFNGKEGIVPPFNEEMVKRYHPNPSALSASGWKLMSRNSYQVLGLNLDDASDFVLCWTPDGKDSGGTGQALRIARTYQIPIFNFRNQNDFDRFQTFMVFNYNLAI
jgi:hypothetical protein